MTLRDKAIQEAVRAITEQRRRFQRKWVEGGMSHADLPEPPNELVARAAFDAFVAAIMEPDEAMIEAGARAIAPGLFSDDLEIARGAAWPIRVGSSRRNAKRDALASHQAMIRKLMGGSTGG
jgi:hypothetical protein